LIRITPASALSSPIERDHRATAMRVNHWPAQPVSAVAIRRLGQPSDVAPMVALLASDAGGWITGQTISISGGFSMI